MRRPAFAAGLLLALLGRAGPAVGSVNGAAETGWNGTFWGETSAELVKQFGKTVKAIEARNEGPKPAELT